MYIFYNTLAFEYAYYYSAWDRIRTIKYNIQNSIIIMRLYNIGNVGEKQRLYARLLHKGRAQKLIYSITTFPALVCAMARLTIVYTSICVYG